MNHPDFKHRTLTDEDYSDFTLVDLQAAFEKKISEFTDLNYIVSSQFGLPLEDRLDDSANKNMMDLMRGNIQDIEVIFEWFLSHYEVVRTEDYFPEDEEDSIVTIPTDIKTLN